MGHLGVFAAVVLAAVVAVRCEDEGVRCAQLDTLAKETCRLTGKDSAACIAIANEGRKCRPVDLLGEEGGRRGAVRKARQATLRAKKSAAKLSCSDTPGWKNPNFNCKYYALKWCHAGKARKGMQWALGARFKFPERNCCVCGRAKYLQALAAKSLRIAKNVGKWKKRHAAMLKKNYCGSKSRCIPQKGWGLMDTSKPETEWWGKAGDVVREMLAYFKFLSINCGGSCAAVVYGPGHYMLKYIGLVVQLDRLHKQVSGHGHACGIKFRLKISNFRASHDKVKSMMRNAVEKKDMTTFTNPKNYWNCSFAPKYEVITRMDLPKWTQEHGPIPVPKHIAAEEYMRPRDMCATYLLGVSQAFEAYGAYMTLHLRRNWLLKNDCLKPKVHSAGSNVMGNDEEEET